MRFYLGTHRPPWLRRCGVPLFVSHRTLKKSKKRGAAVAPWALDSGGFTELSTFGEWRTTAAEYVEAVEDYAENIGLLDWAAPRDWMCEPWIIAETGRTVTEHQHLTCEDFLNLRSMTDAPIIPVIQGWEQRDYEAHVAMYRDEYGVDLTSEPTVGIGSVCRREASDDIARILAHMAGLGLRLHGFGVKKGGLAKASPYLVSADSMAWSFGARYEPPLPGHEHKTCANCMEFALRWRDQIVTTLGGDAWSQRSSFSQASWQPTLPSPTSESSQSALV